jgi:AsmA protein
VKRRAIIIVGVIVGLFILFALVVPLFIDANQYKPKLEDALSGALGRQVGIGNLSLTVWSASVSMDGISIADDPAFSHSPFLTAKRLSAGVSLWPLIFSKRLDVSSFTITDPQVVLLRSPSGRWNYSSLGAAGGGTPKPQQGTAQSDPPASSSAATKMSVEKLRISNGTVTVGMVGAARVRTYQKVDLKASDLSYTTQFPFELTADTPGGGNVKLDGKAGPVNATDASMTPVNATIGVEGLDLQATGFIEPSSGVGGLVDFKGELVSNGEQMTSKGTAKAGKLQLAPNSSPATVPINLDYATTYDLKSRMGTLTEGEVHIGKAVASLGGTFDASGDSPTVQMKMEGKSMPVPDLEGVLPAIGVNLPSGASLKTGTLDATLAITGPVDKLTIAGPVDLSNAKLAGFDLKGKLGALASFTGLRGGDSSNTEIQTLSAALKVDAQGTQFQNLNLVVPSLAAVTGNGNVSSTKQLDCHLVAKLPQGSLAGAVGSALSGLAGGGAGGGIPFKVTGTTSSPKFEPDFGGHAGSNTTAKSNPSSEASSILGGLLKKKSKP